MKYEFRKLNSTDLFPMCTIITKIGVDNIASVLDMNQLLEVIKTAKENGGDTASQEYLAGIGLVLKVSQKILEGLPRCEKEIYNLLSSVSGLTVKEVKELELDEFFEMIVEFIRKDEFKSFFKVASKFVGQ